MVKHALLSQILEFIEQQESRTQAGVSAGVIEAHVGRPRPTVNRVLVRLLNEGQITRQGGGRSIVYHRVVPLSQGHSLSEPVLRATQSLAVLEYLSLPLGARTPVTYQRKFVDDYEPNVSSLLPVSLALDLVQQGCSKDNLPAGTYARKVLEQLLIDLSWSSSRLEGNKKSLLDTYELFRKGHSGPLDQDTVMLLNHKAAIEFLVDAVPLEGITVPVIRNLQSILMRDLLADSSDLGAIRTKIVNIQDTVYTPNQAPAFLQEMLENIIAKSRFIKNPIESAFFLWVNLAYLQPFVDGNKRTSRLASNMPLLLSNCVPLSFLNVEQNDYAMAMLGVYERLDPSIAVDLFEHTYRRSIQTYQVVVESMQVPDPLRLRYREQLSEAISQVVYFGAPLEKAVSVEQVKTEDKAAFIELVRQELEVLEAFNCARYRLPTGKTQEWIAKGRPH